MQHEKKETDKKSESPVIKFCESCVGNAACIQCSLPIVSNSRVVKALTINGITANWFFCKRSCFKEFRLKYLTKKKDTREKTKTEHV